MSNSNQIQILLNGLIKALQEVIPQNVKIGAPSLYKQPFTQHEAGVLIGIIGDLRARIILESKTSIFSQIGLAMYGMEINGEMLESFIGEFGNMTAGKFCTYCVEQQFDLDITPPTVMIGETKLYGFQHAFKLPITISDLGEMNVLLTIDDDDY
ncbi:chemotaxis protein CheX [Kurthia senegalensis]|uniref:chemotaxis protein CheX n=1 Tax=Kurthia senegalensis TaxID=1033740 RepID=UPI000288CD4A|nr:chemotaxis protein CheX [Kurthia senegalensis]